MIRGIVSAQTFHQNTNKLDFGVKKRSFVALLGEKIN